MSHAARPVALSRLPCGWALLAAVLGGVLLAQSFPGAGWWWSAIPGIALVLAGLRGRTIRGSFLVGLVAGESCYLTLIAWATAFLGPLPWVALSTVEALFFAGGGVVVTLVMRWWPRSWPTWTRPAVLAPIIGAVWLLREVNASSWPYHGFAWGRVGQSQADSCFAGLYSWVGISGVSLVVVCLAAALHELCWLFSHRRKPCRAAVAWATTVLLLALVPAYRLQVDGTMLVVGAQGGTEKAGFFFQRETGEVRAAHVAATELADIQLSGRTPDLVVWPEGAAEPDPAADADARRDISTIAERLHAPVLVGAIHEEPDGRLFNTAELWRGSAMVARYDKRRPVPFGEFVPDRQIWSRFAPTEIAMITREYTPGTTRPVVQVGQHRVGVGICFDVIDDDLFRESLADGADVLVYPTNNADFGRTDELRQQVMFARLRAVESGRSVFQVSTVGTTAAFDPQGHQIAHMPWYTQGALAVELPVTRGRTPAVVLAHLIELAASAFGVVALVALGGARVATSCRRSR